MGTDNRGETSITRRYIGEALELFDSSDSAGMALEAVGAARMVEQEAEILLARAVAKARSAGSTWHEIGGALEVSRQAAWERFRSIDLDLAEAGESDV